MRRVLVTRSEPGAHETAARLVDLGYEPVLAPLRIISPVAHDATIAADALAFTSAAAVRAWTGRRDAPAFAVGAATAAAARDAGFADVHSADADGAALADLIVATLPAGARLAHVRGEEVAFDLASALSTRGLAVTPVIVYRAAAPTRLPDGALDGLHAALIHSPAGARTLSALAPTDSLRPVRAVCLSTAVAAGLDRAAWRSIEVADAPTENALLARLTAAQG